MNVISYGAMRSGRLLIALILFGFLGCTLEAVKCNCLLAFCDFGESTCEGDYCVVVEHHFLPFYLQKCGDGMIGKEECYGLEQSGDFNIVKPTRVCFCKGDYCNTPFLFNGGYISDASNVRTGRQSHTHHIHHHSHERDTDRDDDFGHKREEDEDDDDDHNPKRPRGRQSTTEIPTLEIILTPRINPTNPSILGGRPNANGTGIIYLGGQPEVDLQKPRNPREELVHLSTTPQTTRNPRVELDRLKTPQPTQSADLNNSENLRNPTYQKTINIEVIIERETTITTILLVCCVILSVIILALCVLLLYNMRRIRALIKKMLEKSKATTVTELQTSGSRPRLPSAPPHNPGPLFVRSDLPFSPPPYQPDPK